MNLSEKIVAGKERPEFIFEEIFREYHQKVYFYILSKTKSAYIAEEVTQLTFIKLWNKGSWLDHTLPLSAQLFQIAKTTCIDVLRKEGNRSRLAVVGTDHHTQDVSRDLDTRELQTKLAKEVQRMPPVRKTVFELSRYQSKSYKEIANQLSLSEKTVENHISLALKQLRRVLSVLLIFFLR